MSLLRIYASLREPPQQCRWVLLDAGAKAVAGEGPLAHLPRGADKVQLVLAASDVLLARVRLPQGARRRGGATLGYAVEEMTAAETDALEVCWLGVRGGSDVLAVLDRPGLQRWLDALEAAGIHGCDLHCETLMLPLVPGEWSFAWNGREGFLRSGEFEGAATDCGERAMAPLSLRLMLEEAKSRGEEPSSIAVYTTGPEEATQPALDVAAWQRSLGIATRLAGSWDWRSAPADAGFTVMQQRRRWRVPAGTLARLKPAAWLAGAALALHAVALGADWALLASEQSALRRQMEVRFRSVFPESVAVADPSLQMRRKLAEVRHAAGQADGSDFLPMIEKVAAAAKDLPAGTVRVAAYESGRLTIELVNADEALVRRVVARIVQTGLRAEPSPAAARAGRTGPSGSTNVILTVRAT